MIVKLIYFKRSGKFYGEGSYKTEEENLHQIWEDVEIMRDTGILPGLAEGHSKFIVSVDVPEHELNHPHLII